MEDQSDRVWKVLVVDDNAPSSRLVEMALSASGIGACIALNADQARAELRASTIGMVVMDVLLPLGSSGLALAQEIRRDEPYMPILFVASDPKSLEHFASDERLLKSEEDFGQKLVKKVRDEMPRFISRHESREVASTLRKMLPRVVALEEANVAAGEVLKAHTEQLGKLNRVTRRVAIAKQLIGWLVMVAGPVVGALWYLTKDIAREQIHEIVHIAPMREKLESAVSKLNALVADRELDRRERLQASAEQRTINAKQEALQSTMIRILDRLPERAPMPAPAPDSGAMAH